MYVTQKFPSSPMLYCLHLHKCEGQVDEYILGVRGVDQELILAQSAGLTIHLVPFSICLFV